MNPVERSQLLSLFVGMSAYYGQEIPDPALRLYVDDLDDLPFDRVAWALKELRRDPKTTRCPLPAVIRAKLNPEADPESEATLIASRIVGCVAKIGPYRSVEARMALGPVGWAVIQMEGGWESVCENLTYDKMGTLKAQWRNLAKVLIDRGVSKFETTALEDKRSGGLSSLGDVLSRIEGPKEST